MSRLFRSNVDPIPFLEELASYSAESKKWKTSYGVSFEKFGIGDMWIYRYDEDIEKEKGLREGIISATDVALALKQLQQEPTKLREKPRSIEYLEKKLGKQAHRKHNKFGAWHISDEGRYSMFNNPFSCELGYSDSSDNYEVWYMEKEEKPRKYQSVDQIEETLKGYNII